jgi:SCF-associated factor 1
MPGIQDLPVELVLDNFLPNLDLESLLNLSCTSKHFAALGNEGVLWKRKLLDDYNFDGSATARQHGWKVIYKGLV